MRRQQEYGRADLLDGRLVVERHVDAAEVKDRKGVIGGRSAHAGKLRRMAAGSQQRGNIAIVEVGLIRRA